MVSMGAGLPWVVRDLDLTRLGAGREVPFALWWGEGGPGASLARQDHVAHDRVDLLLPALAGEHAVVADAGLHVMAAFVGPDARAQVMGRRRLAQRADVVALAFHCEQRGAADGAGLDARAAVVELAPGQPGLLENPLDRLKVELGREVQHGEILVVEGLGGLRLLDVAAGQVLVEVQVCLAVAVDVHGHEGGELHEAGVDPPPGAGVAGGTRAIRFCSNHSIGLLMASALTLVGLMRVSIGPAISVMLRGWAGLFAWAMTATAVSTCTHGWQTATTCERPPRNSSQPTRWAT